MLFELLHERLSLLSDLLDIVGRIDECGRSLLLALVRDDGGYLWWSGVPLVAHSDLKRLPIAPEEYLVVMDIGDAVAFDGVGNLFVANQGGGDNTVLKFTPSGVGSVFASAVRLARQPLRRHGAVVNGPES